MLILVAVRKADLCEFMGALIAVVVVVVAVGAARAADEGVNDDTMDGKVYVGYPGSATVEYWPDLTGFDEEGKYHEPIARGDRGSR